MKVKVIAVGTRMSGWVSEGIQDYLKRFPREFSIKFVEVPLGERPTKKGKSQYSAKAVTQEGQSILSALDPRERVIALDVKGESWSSETLAQHMENWQMEGDNVALLIGGPDGLSSECLFRAQQRWSLSALTLPHPLVRVLLVEQLYRGSTILKNHPYHK
ncbi:23S rRNA (pseudouridine(1915)-N(3))-methyltransferase RlmH [Candidatus Endobugula sertula]|uniref:Ribosomal RNA large subunit methyltransferase H n=1 Tax=Candidatus Endobugula sertula TaxID=62101 RepID=A0A1D2QQ99_9GAMM|nr:23S rRNA (pseudouridine(1915)-N(3))-methyltransferase RlmH [Candidatus Endobugula sertula]